MSLKILLKDVLSHDEIGVLVSNYKQGVSVRELAKKYWEASEALRIFACILPIPKTPNPKPQTLNSKPYPGLSELPETPEKQTERSKQQPGSGSSVQ